jgi:hypothetical protein
LEKPPISALALTQSWGAAANKIQPDKNLNIAMNAMR